LSLLCPAQSYPQAIFRYDKKLKFLWFFWVVFLILWFATYFDVIPLL
jgi:hypothetical protein